jgi:hypothetical protein
MPLLKSAQIQNPWKIYQLWTGNKVATWAVDVYLEPKSVDAFCEVRRISLGIKQEGLEFKIEEASKPQLTVSLKSCYFSAPADFHSPRGQFSEFQLSSALHLVSDLLSSKGESPLFEVRFDEGDLRACWRKVKIADLADISIKANGSTSLSFWIKGMVPDSLDVEIKPLEHGISRVEISRGKNPDLRGLLKHEK